MVEFIKHYAVWPCVIMAAFAAGFGLYKIFLRLAEPRG